MYNKKLLYDIDWLLPKNPTLIIGCSGGPDSVFLGELLVQTLPVENLVVAHFNHKLRKESDSDEIFCKKWAKKHKILFFSQSWKNPIHSEEKARTARNNFLNFVLQEQGASAIALGTHADDEAETIFFNFIRGSGLSGISGIPSFDSKTKRFRPLLSYTKKEILKELKKTNTSYCTDSSNFESLYSRNFLRNDIFPKLEKRFPHFPDRLRRQAKIFSRIDDYIEKSAEEFLKNNKKKISRSQFLNLHEALQSEILRLIFMPRNIDFQQVERLRNFIISANSGKKIEMKNIIISVYSEYFFIEEK